MNAPSDDYARVERAIRFLEREAARQPGLAEVAAHVHLSEFHFQRLFKRWAGVSPKRFLQVVTLELAKERLRERGNVLAAAWDAGLSGPGRLHDLFVTLEAVTPGEFKARGAGLEIGWGVQPSPFGACLLGLTGRGICHLDFIDPDPGAKARALERLRAAWPRAEFVERPREAEAAAGRIFEPRAAGEPLPVLAAGTNFQVRVWSALLRIPAGATATYAELARSLGRPRAARAVGQALARNRVAYLIPCHRVIAKLGVLGGYRWGPERKKAMLAWERTRAEAEA
ncbi:MAG: bifunctional helix-turn-helix domain-containing protein/methylated-DNA--[protein]-cysteine S-methyltransferase [Planctomycetota bacterium]|nr:bifunctional helix-turn-helix domain-containing protein/methylated-DNA--[protein]-cysteine S-methyltransferase [Planctomycetota bacterium]